MKRFLSASLVLAILTSVPVGMVQAEKPVKEEGKGKGGEGKGERNDHGNKDDDGDDDDGDDDDGDDDSDDDDGDDDSDDDSDDDDDDDDDDGDSDDDDDDDDGDDDDDDSDDDDDVDDDVDDDREGKDKHGKGNGKKDATVHQPAPGANTDPAAPGSQQQLNKKEAVQKAVKTKKEIIELRQQVKHATELTEELKAKYEELTAQLEELTELTEALEVQKELLDRFYKPGDASQYEKLGELYEKAGDQSLKTFVNGTEVEMDVPPFIEKGRALVPVRAISASLKADVNWNAEERTVEVVRGETKITLYLDSDEADVNGTKVPLETAPVMKNGRVFLPLRFIGEQLKTKVGYQQEGDIIIIEDGQQEGTESDGVAEEQPAEQTAEQPAEQTTEQPAEQPASTETP